MATNLMIGSGTTCSKPKRNRVVPLVNLEQAARDMERRSKAYEDNTGPARRAEREARRKQEIESQIRALADEDIRSGRTISAVFGDVPEADSVFLQMYEMADPETRAIMEDQLKKSTRQFVAETRQTLAQPSQYDDPVFSPGLGELFHGTPEQMQTAWDMYTTGSGLDKKWIQKAIKHPGALHKTLGIPKDQTIPMGTLRKAAKLPGVTGRRARLAITLRGFKKGSGQTQSRVYPEEQPAEEPRRRRRRQPPMTDQMPQIPHELFEDYQRAMITENRRVQADRQRQQEMLELQAMLRQQEAARRERRRTRAEAERRRAEAEMIERATITRGENQRRRAEALGYQVQAGQPTEEPVPVGRVPVGEQEGIVIDPSNYHRLVTPSGDFQLGRSARGRGLRRRR